MTHPSRISRSVSFTFCAAACLLIAVSCHDSRSSPTAPAGGASISGTVIRGSGTFGARTQGMEIGLSGVTVTIVKTGQSAMTDASGNFTLTGVPSGDVDLELKRTDFDVKVKITVSAGSTTADITISVVGSSAVVTARGHAGEEIEGLVQSTGATLVVLDNRLGAVTVKTDSTTIIRRGDAAILLSQIQTGMRVHVKALLQSDGTYLATEILLQDEKVGGESEVEGTVATVDTAHASFTVTTASGPITVKTDSGTAFKMKGSTASFSDVVTGAMVDVEGTLQSDGSVLARKVTIE
jgi:hypothetical protein